MEVSEGLRDPFTAFLTELHVSFDMEAAHQHLREAEALFQTDFFLCCPPRGHIMREDFMESARRLLFENYCKTHERINLSVLASRLRVTEEEVTAKVMRYIRELGLAAKIDCENNLLVMERETPSVYEAVLTKTKGLTRKTEQLIATLAIN
jgi:translation initiation factor 3 subunit E